MKLLIKLLMLAAALAVCQADSAVWRKLQQFGDPGQPTCPILYCKNAASCIFVSRTKAWQCKACTFPRIPNSRQTECVCPVGQYPVASGGCALCKMDQFCPLGTSATKSTARACPANTVTLKTGAKSINECFNAPGYRYFKTSSGVRAIACGDDEYNVGLKKQTVCTKCMPGFRTDPGNPPGIHTSSAVCVAPPGSFVAGDSVVPCPRGEYSDSYDAATSCTPCVDVFGEGITTQRSNSSSKADCKWLERGYALVDDRKKVITTTLSTWITNAGGQWLAAKPCPQNYYCPGGDPDVAATSGGGAPQPCPGPGSGVAGSAQLWTEDEGASSVDECVAPPGWVFNAGNYIMPCEQGQYKEGWNRLTTCDNCAGTTVSALLTGDLWLSDATTYINKLDPNTGMTMQQVPMRGSPENCYIQRGMGVLSLRDVTTGVTYLKAIICPADAYGVVGQNISGTYKKYGRSVTPCTACPANMQTAQYATSALNAENQITNYLTKSGPLKLDTTVTSYASTGGYYSIDACSNVDGFGYYAGSSQICPQGTYNAKGNEDPCKQCPYGTTTADAVPINIDVGYCNKYIQGYGLVNGATGMCAVGTFQSYDVTKDFDGEACTSCTLGYTTSGVGSIRIANCSLCAAGYGDLDPLSGPTASPPGISGLTCSLCLPGYYGPASRTATPCLACPTGRTYTYSWGGTDDVFMPLATSPVGAKDINDCVADMAQTVDGAFELPLTLTHATISKLTTADNLSTCAQRCRDDSDCAAITFDYLDVACYTWKPTTDAPFKTAGGVAMKVYPSQNLALSKLNGKAMGNGQYTFWMDGSASGVPAAIDKTGATYYVQKTIPTTLQTCLDLCTSQNMCVGVAFGAYDIATDGIAASSCYLILAKVQPGNSRRSLIKASFNTFVQSLKVPPGYYTDPGSNILKLCNDDVDAGGTDPLSYYCEGGLIGTATRKVCAAVPLVTAGLYTPPDAAAAADCWSLLKPGYYFDTAGATYTAAVCPSNKYCPGSVVGGYKYVAGTSTAGTGSEACPTGTTTTTAGTAATDSTACNALVPGYYYTGVPGVSPAQLTNTNVLLCPKGQYCPGDGGALQEESTTVAKISASLTTSIGRGACRVGTTTVAASVVGTLNTAPTDCKILSPTYYHNGASTAVSAATIVTCAANGYCPGSSSAESYSSTVVSGIFACPGYTCSKTGCAANAASGVTPAGGSGTDSTGQASINGCTNLDAGWYYAPGSDYTIKTATIVVCPVGSYCDGGTSITNLRVSTGITGTCPQGSTTASTGISAIGSCLVVQAGYYYSGGGAGAAPTISITTISPCLAVTTGTGWYCAGVTLPTTLPATITSTNRGLTACTSGSTCVLGTSCQLPGDCKP